MARLKAGSRTIEALVRRGMDPKVQAQQVAKIHRQLVAETDAHNKAILGMVPPSETYVDGRAGAALESVKLDGGVILTRYEALTEVVDYVWEMLARYSPVGHGPYADGHSPGRYRESHRLFADGAEMEPGSNTVAKTYIFVSTLPYSRKVEKGQGSAPDEGVYEGAVELAKARFGNLADVRFTYQAVIEGGVQDYSDIALGGRRGGKLNKTGPKREAYKAHNENRFPAIIITPK